MDDLKYAGIKITELEQHISEQVWREKHLILHHGYPIPLYVFTVIVCLFVIIPFIQWLESKEICRRVAGALNLRPSNKVDTAVAGPNNVVNIDIKTSNESLAFAPESVPLRRLTPSDTKGTESETRTSRRLRS